MIGSLLSSVLCGQTMRGLVTSDSKPINAASILLKDSRGKVLTYTFTDSEGRFSLTTAEIGELTLKVHAMGYELVDRNITTTVGQVIETDIDLLAESIALEEVSIITKRPIRREGNKTIFDAEFYLQGEEEVLEDLLKKIPGLTISDDGMISVGNQEIEKLMVDGDDLFDKGYSILTKNMSVSPIDKVEVLNQYSNNKHLNGIENSQKVALNITLKEDFKRKWFGNINGGLGFLDKERYEVRSNLMNFGNKSKYYFLTNINTVGYDAKGNIDNLIRPGGSSGSFSDMGEGETVSSFVKFIDKVPSLTRQRIFLSNSKIASLNSLFMFSEKTKMKLLGFVNSEQNIFSRKGFELFRFEESSFRNTESFRGLSKDFTLFGQVDFNYDISSNSTLQYIGKFNYGDESTKKDVLLNENSVEEKLKTDKHLEDHRLVFTRKLNDQSVFFISGRYTLEKKPQNYTINQLLFPALFSEEANNIIQNITNSMQFIGLEASLIDRKKNNNLLELKIGNQLRIDQLENRFQLKNNDSVVLKPKDFQNDLTYRTNDLYMNGKYSFFMNQFLIYAQLEIHQRYNSLNQLDEKKTESLIYLSPKVGFEWSINPKNRMNSSYMYGTKNVKLADVYANYIQTDYRTFSRGINQLQQLESSQFILNYSYGRISDNFFATIFLTYIKNHDFFSSHSTVTQSYTLNEKIMLQNSDLFIVSSSIDRYFKFILSNLKLTLSTNLLNHKNKVNESEIRTIINKTIDYGLELRSGFKGVFNYHLGTKWTKNMIKVDTDRSYTNNKAFVDLLLQFNKKLSVQIKNENYYFGNLESRNSNYYFLDFTAKYPLIENKLSLSFSGNNLFNQRRIRNNTISDIFVSQTDYRLQPSYLLFKVDYRF